MEQALVTLDQCEWIGQFSKYLGGKLSFKISQNVW